MWHLGKHGTGMETTSSGGCSSGSGGGSSSGGSSGGGGGGGGSSSSSSCCCCFCTASCVRLVPLLYSATAPEWLTDTRLGT